MKPLSINLPWKSACVCVCYFETNANANSTVLPTAYDDFPLPKMNLEDDLKALLALPPTEPELETTLKQCKSNTIAGIDELNSNMLKLGAEAKVNWLKLTSDQIWLEETVPDDWRKQIIVPIYKKGSKLQCTNYRGISVMSVANKVAGKAILNRLKHVLDTQLEENQCGFRPKRRCCDQIYVARMLIQKAREFNRPLYFCFIDLQKPYDSINREALWQSQHSREDHSHPTSLAPQHKRNRSSRRANI